ncbi:MAG: FkbM family methyltransferase [Chitinophagales bacterium]|nr:FkbM family methyltransferase [Chitinophagales bacterium]
MELLAILKRLYLHPLGKREGLKSILRFIWWQTYSRIIQPQTVVPFIGNTHLLLRRGMTGATGHFYYGLGEFEFTSFLLHFLKPDDLFIDVGANIGAYSILASGVCGARSIAIEPLPNTFANLKEQILLNNLESLITTLNIGIGDKVGQLFFTENYDQNNHVTSINNNSIKIPAYPLEGIINDTPSLIKIDVEGYEFPVLLGANKLLRASSLKAIIIESMNLGKRYGYADDQIDRFLRSYGFFPFQYFPKERKLIPLETYRIGGNNLYLRNKTSVMTKVKEGKCFHLSK